MSFGVIRFIFIKKGESIKRGTYKVHNKWNTVYYIFLSLFQISLFFYSEITLPVWLEYFHITFPWSVPWCPCSFLSLCVSRNSEQYWTVGCWTWHEWYSIVRRSFVRGELLGNAEVLPSLSPVACRSWGGRSRGPALSTSSRLQPGFYRLPNPTEMG